jgi:hypothetical protein
MSAHSARLTSTGLVKGLAGVGVAAAAMSAVTLGGAAGPVAAADATTTFGMVRSTAAVGAGCLVGAKATVSITPLGGAERMVVKASGLPAHTELDLFVIQTPDAPFGLSWYQGDLVTDASGTASRTFVGRFNRETFTVAPGSTVAPKVHSDPIPDATSNPATAPVHQFHLGLWFGSPQDAAAAGCPDTVTPFNGDHDAGVQALSTRNFPVKSGPLRQVS